MDIVDITVAATIAFTVIPVIAVAYLFFASGGRKES